MRDIRASPEVAAIVGSEDLRRLRTSPAFGPYTCWGCGRSGSADTEPTSVVVELYAVAARVALAHARCAPSHVVHRRGIAPAGLADAAGADMAAQAAVLPSRPHPQPVLILEPRTEIATRSPGGERIDLALSRLLDLGLSLVHTVPDMPAPAPGWQLDLLTRHQLRLTAPGPEVVYQGTCGQPRPWRPHIARTGTCVVLTGTAGLYAHPGLGDPVQLLGMLDAAARGGRLVGGLVTVTPRP